MASLTENDRAGLWAAFMADLSAVQREADLTKADVRAAVNAVDDWCDQNSIGALASIPEPAATALTTKEKIELFVRVVNARHENEVT